MMMSIMLGYVTSIVILMLMEMMIAVMIGFVIMIEILDVDGNDDEYYAWKCYFDCNIHVDGNDDCRYVMICYYD